MTPYTFNNSDQTALSNVSPTIYLPDDHMKFSCQSRCSKFQSTPRKTYYAENLSRAMEQSKRNQEFDLSDTHQSPPELNAVIQYSEFAGTQERPPENIKENKKLSGTSDAPQNPPSGQNGGVPRGSVIENFVSSLKSPNLRWDTPATIQALSIKAEVETQTCIILKNDVLNLNDGSCNTSANVPQVCAMCYNVIKKEVSLDPGYFNIDFKWPRLSLQLKEKLYTASPRSNEENKQLQGTTMPDNMPLSANDGNGADDSGYVDKYPDNESAKAGTIKNLTEKNERESLNKMSFDINDEILEKIIDLEDQVNSLKSDIATQTQKKVDQIKEEETQRNFQLYNAETGKNAFDPLKSLDDRDLNQLHSSKAGLSEANKRWREYNIEKREVTMAKDVKINDDSSTNTAATYISEQSQQAPNSSSSPKRNIRARRPTGMPARITLGDSFDRESLNMSSDPKQPQDIRFDPIRSTREKQSSLIDDIDTLGTGFDLKFDHIPDRNYSSNMDLNNKTNECAAPSSKVNRIYAPETPSTSSKKDVDFKDKFSLSPSIYSPNVAHKDENTLTPLYQTEDPDRKPAHQLDVCEQSARVCRCAATERSGAAVFQSCSGTRFLATSTAANKFKHCACSQRPRAACGQSTVKNAQQNKSVYRSSVTNQFKTTVNLEVDKQPRVPIQNQPETNDSENYKKYFLPESMNFSFQHQETEQWSPVKNASRQCSLIAQSNETLQEQRHISTSNISHILQQSWFDGKQKLYDEISVANTVPRIPNADVNRDNDPAPKKYQRSWSRDDRTYSKTTPRGQQRSVVQKRPQTYILTGEAEVVKGSDYNTDNEISSMTDLPSEKEMTATTSSRPPQAPLSPGERGRTPTYRDTATMPSEYGLLSEGEVPTDRWDEKDRKPRSINKIPRASSDERVAQKMEATLKSINDELSRCRRMLMDQWRVSMNSQTVETKDASAMVESCPSPIELRTTDAKPCLSDKHTPICVFKLHIGSLVLSDEAVINSRALELVLKWQFYDHSVTMTRLPPGRVTRFDVTSEYEVKLTSDFLDYMKYDSMAVQICEMSVPQKVFAKGSLSLREALNNINCRTDMSLPLVCEAARHDSVLVLGGRKGAKANPEGAVGVLDLWCQLQADYRTLPTIQRNMPEPPHKGQAQLNRPDPPKPQVSMDDYKQDFRISTDYDMDSKKYPQNKSAPSFRPLEIKTSSGILVNEVAANITSPHEMKRALEKSRNRNDDVHLAPRTPSLLSTIMTARPDDKTAHRRAAASNKQRLSLGAYSQDLSENYEIQPDGTWKKIYDPRVPVRKLSPVESLKGETTLRPSETRDGDSTVNKFYGRGNKTQVTRKTLDDFKRVKIKKQVPLNRLSADSYTERRQSREESRKTPTMDITVQWLALNDECDAMLNPNVQRLYVAYNFLGRDGADLETPVSLPKPKQYHDKCHFNFKKTFELTDADVPQLGRLARCRDPGGGAVDSRDCVVFTVVSEPPEDPLALHDCEDVGMAYLYLGDLLSYSAGSDNYAEVLPVQAASDRGGVCGVLAIRVDGLDVVRRCLSLVKQKYSKVDPDLW